MEKELQLKLVEILTAIQTAAGKASDFALDQLPDIAQQYVVYGMVVAAVKVLALALPTVAAGYYAWWAYRNPWYSTYSWHRDQNVRADSNYMAMWIAGVACFVFAGMVFAAIADGALVWFAPKVWLLKELAALVKGTTG